MRTLPRSSQAPPRYLQATPTPSGPAQILQAPPLPGPGHCTFADTTQDTSGGFAQFMRAAAVVLAHHAFAGVAHTLFLAVVQEHGRVGLWAQRAPLSGPGLALTSLSFQAEKPQVL